MAKREQLFRLFDIIDILKRNDRGATYQEVRDYVEKQHQAREDELSDIPFSEKTFKRDRDLIFDFFLIEVKYKRSTHTYRIDQDEDLGKVNQIFDNLLLVNAYRKTKNQSEIMFFEKRLASGLQNLEGLIFAIKNSKIITFNYTKHWEGVVRKRIVEPYALKEFKNRWYLLAFEKNNSNFHLKTFGLDRISDLDISNKKFNPENVNVEEMFTNSFGIISTLKKKPEKVVLSFDFEQGKFIKSLPIHQSQKVLIDNEKEFRIEILISPTYDFYQELLSHTGRLTIVEPISVRTEFSNFLKQGLKLNH